MFRMFVLFLGIWGTVFGEESKVVLITGASKGVGLATVEYLAEKKFTVYGATREPSAIAKNIQFLQVDLLEEASISKAVKQILEKHGRIDVLINNAGYALIGPLESLTQEEMLYQMEVNFFAPIRYIQAVLPHMRERKSGHIINISSMNAFYTPPFGGMYAASKSALESLSESLAIEVLPYHIFVSIVEPGMLQTRFSLVMGTKEVPNNPYQKITDWIEKETAQRLASPETFPDSQSAQEIAEFLLAIIQDPSPKLRYQTSEEAKREALQKLVDFTGEIYLEEMGRFFGDKNKGSVKQ